MKFITVILIVGLAFTASAITPLPSVLLEQLHTGIVVPEQAFGANLNVYFANPNNLKVNNQYGAKVPVLSDPGFHSKMRELNLSVLRINGDSGAPLLQLVFPSRESALSTASIPTGTNATSAPNRPNSAVLDNMISNLPKFFRGKLYLTIGRPPISWGINCTDSNGKYNPPKALGDGCFNITDSVDRYLYVSMTLKIVNYLKERGLTVDYLQAINEPNSSYYVNYRNPNPKPTLCGDSVSSMLGYVSSIDNALYAKVKAFDKKIRVGGPELGDPDQAWLEVYTKCVPDAEFLSYHQYGRWYNPATTIATPEQTQLDMQNAAGTGPTKELSYYDNAKSMRAVKSIPIFLMEYNMNAAWDPSDPRQSTVQGAVYNAIALTRAIQGLVSFALVWDAFSKNSFALFTHTAGEYVTTPYAYLLMKMHSTLANTLYVPSKVVTTDAPNVHSFASISPDKKTLNLILINYDQANDQTVTPLLYSNNVFVNLASIDLASNYENFEVSSKFPRGSTSSLSNADRLDTIKLPANSVSVLTFHAP